MAHCCFPATSRPGGPLLCTPPLLLHTCSGSVDLPLASVTCRYTTSRSARMGTAFPHASAPWCARCRLCSGRDFSADFQRQNDRACDFCILETRRPSSGFVVAGDTQDFTDRPGCQKVIEWRRMPPASCLREQYVRSVTGLGGAAVSTVCPARRHEAAATPSALPAMRGDRRLVCSVRRVLALGEVVHPVTSSRKCTGTSTTVNSPRNLSSYPCPVGAGEEGQRHGARPVPLGNQHVPRTFRNRSRCGLALGGSGLIWSGTPDGSPQLSSARCRCGASAMH